MAYPSTVRESEELLPTVRSPPGGLPGAARSNAPYCYGAVAQIATAATLQLRLVGSSSIAITSTNVEKGCIWSTTTSVTVFGKVPLALPLMS
jgi:hypothetical protein